MDYSIDLQAEQISNKKTAAYFKEVISSYHNQNYGSAIVMLYSITLADLIFKLKELHETYDDEKANTILTEIEDLQKRNPHSPEWEPKLIERVYQNTSLLETADYQHILHLQKLRHLCAHPVIDQNYELYRPNKETVRAQMRNILEGLLCKPVLVSKDIFNDLLEDIAKNELIFYEDKELKRYLKAKYLDHLNLQVEKQIFRSLWKITLFLDNKQCQKNRDINFRTLRVIMLHNPKNHLSEIQDDSTYFSKINLNAIPYLLQLINSCPPTYDALTEDFRIILDDKIDSDKDYFVLAWFKQKNLKTHLDYLYTDEFEREEFGNDYVTIETLSALADDIERIEGEGTRNKFLIDTFGSSYNYDIADERYLDLIEPYMYDFDEEDFKSLLKHIHENSQLHDRRKARRNNWSIKKVIDEKYIDFNFKPYSNFN